MRGFILVWVLAAAMPLSAITVVPLSFAELVERSTAVVHGRVSEVRGQWSPDRHSIDSVLSLDALDYFKGELGERVSVRVPGGQVGGFVNIIPGAPRFSEGDHVVLFLKVDGPSIPIVTGTTQGVFRVTADPGSGALLVVPPVMDSTAAAGPMVRGDARRRPLAMPVFAAAVKSAQAAR
jgi:hypothetical protein